MSTSSVHQVASNTPEQPIDVVSLGDLDEEVATSLGVDDLDALRAVAEWITTFVAVPNKDLGRSGPVCPFVPGGRERQTLWLAAEQVSGRSVLDVVRLVDAYKRRFLRMQPVDGEDADYKAMVVVFPDLSAERTNDLFGELLEHLQVPSYVEDGLVVGAFHERNDGRAIYNAEFRPFRSPVPFVLIRRAVVHDWKFFLDDEAALTRWAQHFGLPAVQALAAVVRGLPWRAERSNDNRLRPRSSGGSQPGSAADDPPAAAHPS